MEQNSSSDRIQISRGRPLQKTEAENEEKQEIENLIRVRSATEITLKSAMQDSESFASGKFFGEVLYPGGSFDLPLIAFLDRNISDIACGSSHFLLLSGNSLEYLSLLSFSTKLHFNWKDKGRVFSFGSGESGQLGLFRSFMACFRLTKKKKQRTRQTDKDFFSQVDSISYEEGCQNLCLL